MTTNRNYADDARKADDHDLETREIRALEQEMTVCQHIGDARGDDDLYLVVSESGQEYLVDVRQATCDCMDFLQRGECCKHQRRVQLEAGLRPLPIAALSAEIDVSNQLDGVHVDGSPRLPPAMVVADGGHEHDHEAASETCEICQELGEPGCWLCFRDGGE